MQKEKISPQYKQSNKWKQANDFYNVSTKLLKNFKQQIIYILHKCKLNIY